MLSYYPLFQPPGVPLVGDALGEHGCCIIAFGTMGHTSPAKSHLSGLGILVLGQISSWISGPNLAHAMLLILTAISW